VEDRPGHDRRYALNCAKIRDELGWRREVSFRRGLRGRFAGTWRIRLGRSEPYAPRNRAPGSLNQL
jgi:hypothetical protein